MRRSQKCQVCHQQAYYICSKCLNVSYCSKDHQIQHWKSTHKANCLKPKHETQHLLNQLIKKRYSSRKQFYDNYSNQIFATCLLDAKIIANCDRKIRILTNNLLDQFQYGASICLLCRSYYLVQDKVNARMVLQNYLVEANQFLTTMEGVPDASKNLPLLERQLFLRKMSLISTIANLSHVLELECMKYYVLYTKNVEKAFGKQSPQASNCYFLLGCYFAEEGYFKKAIACFRKAALFGGQLAGDCYFNIGILYNFQNDKAKALEMFDMAKTLRSEHHGEQEDSIAEVLENFGIIYADRNDFYSAYESFEDALKIRINKNEPFSPEVNYVVHLIHELYDKLCLYIEAQQSKKQTILVLLKAKIQNSISFTKLSKQKLSVHEQSISNEQAKKRLSAKQNEAAFQKLDEDSQNLIITDELLSKLSPQQLFLLSDLQLELSTTTSKFSKTHMIGKSGFLQQMSIQNLQQLKIDNYKLFKQIRLQQFQKKEKIEIQKNIKRNRQEREEENREAKKKIQKK